MGGGGWPRGGDSLLTKVVILSPAADLGGAERSLLTFLRAAQSHAISTTILLPRPGPLGNELSDLGVSWQVVSMPPALLSLSRVKRANSPLTSLKIIYQGPRYLSRLIKTLSRISPDVIYTNGIKSHILGALIHYLLGVGLVWHLRDCWGGTLVGRLSDFAPHRIIANSRSTARNLQRFMRKPGKVVVIHNAVDMGEFSPDGPAVILSSGSSGFRVGLPAVFARWKGHSLLLRAARIILSEFPSTRFFFIGGPIYDTVGDEGYTDELHHLVLREDLADFVIFTGFQKRMAPWYRAMDVVVNASIRPEPFGRTLLEAMACGRAVVGPNAGGIPEFVQHGENGLLYEMGNAETLAEAVLTLLRDPALRERLGRAGREKAEQFAPEPYAEAITKVLSQAEFLRFGLSSQNY